MLIKELIAQLSKCPQNIEIRLDRYTDIVGISEILDKDSFRPFRTIQTGRTEPTYYQTKVMNTIFRGKTEVYADYEQAKRVVDFMNHITGRRYTITVIPTHKRIYDTQKESKR